MTDLDGPAAQRAGQDRYLERQLDADARRRELIGELVAIRLANHLTQTDVGREMGVSQSVVADIESARFDVRYTTLDRYANAVSRGLVQLEIVRQPGARTSARTGRLKKPA